MIDNKYFDVIIIGGSYAGLSAAMALGRSLRNVLIIDGGSPCNQQTPYSHNFLTQDGKTPKEIFQIAKEQVLNYRTTEFLESYVVSAHKTAIGFMVKTKNNQSFEGKKLVFATGIKDQLPKIKGFAECWGISLVHCPYCHGYEIKNQKTAIIANGEKAYHLAPLVNNLTDNLTIITSGKSDFTEEQSEKFQKHNIKVIEKEIQEIEHENGYLKNILFNDGSMSSFDAAYAVIPFTQHCDIPVALGCELTDTGHIKIDGLQKTTVQGVYACGDNTNLMRSVANAVYMGNLTGALINKDLTDEQF